MPRDEKYDLRAYFDRLYAQTPQALAIKPAAAGEMIGAQVRLRAVLADKLGLAVYGGRTSPVAAVRESIEQCDGYTREKVSLTIADGFVVPCYILKSDGAAGRLPVMLNIYGHGRGAADVLDIPDPCGGEPGRNYMDFFPIQLVKRGFISVVPEMAGFGESYIGDSSGPTGPKCSPISHNLLLLGSCCAGMRVFEAQRVLDYILSRDDTDGERVGMMGISGGGTVTTNTAAVDLRIKLAVVSGYANYYKTSIYAMNHCVDNFIPGVLQSGEMTDVLALIAPRPMMISSGSTDRIFPQGDTRRAVDALSGIYRAFGADNNLETDYFDGGHSISGKVLYDFCVRHLIDK